MPTISTFDRPGCSVRKFKIRHCCKALTITAPNSVPGRVYQNRRRLLVVRGSRYIVPIKLWRPEGCSCTFTRRNLTYAVVMVCILLLVHMREAGWQLSSSRNVDALVSAVEIDSIHALFGCQVSHFLARLRIHDNHFRRRACADEQTRCGFFEGSISWVFASHFPS